MLLPKVLSKLVPGESQSDITSCNESQDDGKHNKGFRQKSIENFPWLSLSFHTNNHIIFPEWSIEYILFPLSSEWIQNTLTNLYPNDNHNFHWFQKILPVCRFDKNFGRLCLHYKGIIGENLQVRLTRRMKAPQYSPICIENTWIIYFLYYYLKSVILANN